MDILLSAKNPPVQIVEANDGGPQGESLVVTLSSDEEEENEITYVGRARRSHGGKKMVMTVGEVLKQRKDGLSYSWKCKLGKLDA